MSNKKYIFFDIDGTIYNSDSVVPESTKKALKIAQQNGHEIFINTGRCRNIVPDNLLEIGFDGIVAGTGSYGEYNDKVLYNITFNEEQVARVLNFTKKHNMPIIMSSAHECVATSHDLPLYAELFTKGQIKAEDFKGLDKESTPFLESISPVVCDDDTEHYYQNHPDVSDFIYINSPFNVKEFNEMIGPDIHVEKASFKEPDDFSGEITLTSCTKGTGILKILEMIGGDVNDSIAVGDGYNDIEMLKTAAISVAMGNAPDDIKNVCDYVTDDINKDGVYNALKQLDLI